MKFKLLAIAVAAASLAGPAQAALTSGTTVNNGSFSLVAWNSVTRDWYIRDLGLFLNDFLPSSITTLAGDGSVSGNRTPEAGLTVNGSNQANFSDASFGTWLAAQTTGEVRWMVGSYDQVSQQSSSNQRRAIVSSADSNDTFLNSGLDNFVSTSNYGGLGPSYFNLTGATLSATGTGMTTQADGGFSSAANFSLVGASASLYYLVRSAYTGSSTSSPTVTKYGNSANFATITLESDGDLIYALAPAGVSEIPLPAAAWMMGAGLLALGGIMRRRRTEA